jgi:hypothetical protein
MATGARRRGNRRYPAGQPAIRERGIAVSGFGAAPEVRDDLSLLRRPSTKSKMPRGAAGAQEHRPGTSSLEGLDRQGRIALITLPPRTR